MISRKLCFSLCATLVLTGSTYCRQVKKASDIFGQWLQEQEVFADRDIRQKSAMLDSSFARLFRAYYEENSELLAPLVPLLSQVTEQAIDGNGYQFSAVLPDAVKNNLIQLYDLLETNPKGFLDYIALAQEPLAMLEKIEMVTPSDQIVRKNNILLHMLFASPEEEDENAYCLAVANRLVECCFGPFISYYQTLLTTKQFFPIARFINALLWQTLVGNGWKHWHQSCLDFLKRRADQGDTIVYIAGGSDWYQLLAHGIYNIKIIDPCLPTQIKNNVPAWEFLIKGKELDGGIGDQIKFGTYAAPCGQGIVLQRSAYKKTGSFAMQMSDGKMVNVPLTVTTWDVLDAGRNKVGQVIVDRRCACTDDFIKREHETFLIAYNELMCAATPEFFGGWSIDIAQLPEDCEIAVKQLRTPVSKAVFSNMRLAVALNTIDLKFINFWTDPR